MILRRELPTYTSAFATLTTISIIVLLVWSSFFDFVLHNQLILSQKSYSFKVWKDISIPIYLEFFFFNWTNPHDLMNPDPEVRKPNLVEVGPYVFSERRKKVVLNWNDNNSTVTYLQNRTWHFEPDLTVGSLDDVVTTLNVPAIAAAHVMRHYPLYAKRALNTVMTLFGTSLHIDKTIGELTFRGYTDPLLDLGSLLPEGLMPISIPFDKFGWFYGRNGSASYDGVYNMYTGKGTFEKFGELAEWNYKNHAEIYKAYCGKVNGSAGEFFKPNLEKESVHIFSSDICRSLKLVYQKEVLVDGIQGIRFVGDEDMFDTSSNNVKHSCFCNSTECPPQGVIDVSACKMNTPAFISNPHFRNADASYHRAVKGMHPNAKIHQLYIDLEQRTGVPLRVEVSMQINLLLQPYSEYTILKNVPKLYFPLLWFKQRACITDNIGSQLRLILRLFTLGYLLFGTIFFVGVVFCILCIINRSKKYTERNNNTDFKLIPSHP